MNISITYKDIKLEAELFDTPTAKAIQAAIPITGEAQVWGEEAYFTIDVSKELESNAQDEVPIGGLAYWPSGNCFCIFWGQTPVSAVNIFGQIKGNLLKLNEIREGDKIVISN